MGTLTCKKCGVTFAAEVPPEVCPRCYRPAKDAFGISRAGLSPVRSVEDLFDLEPVELAAPPEEGGAKVAPGTGKPPLGAMRTLELDDGDLMTPEPQPHAEQADGQPALQPATTLELDEEDLEEREPSAKPPRRHRSVRNDGAPVAPPRHEISPMAVAPPRRRPRPLTSQTATLADALRARRRRRLLTGFWFGAALVGGIAGYRLVTMEREKAPRGAHTEAKGGPPLLVQVNVIDAQARGIEPADAGDETGDGGDGGDVVLEGGAKRRRASTRRSRDGERPRGPRRDGKTSASRAGAERAYQQGLQLLLVNQASLAIVRFNAALKKNPDFALAYRGLGLAYEKLGRNPLARAAYDRYLILKPRASDAELIRKRRERLR